MSCGTVRLNRSVYPSNIVRFKKNDVIGCVEISISRHKKLQKFLILFKNFIEYLTFKHLKPKYIKARNENIISMPDMTSFFFKPYGILAYWKKKKTENIRV